MERRVTTEMDELLNAGAFVGSYTHSLDGKKRVTVPSDWREAAGNPELYILPGVNEKCLYVVTAREMAQRLEKVRAASVANVQAQKFIRDFFSRADRVGLDSQGRIRVKDELLSYAGIINQTVLVGAEFATGSIDVRGSSAIHRFLSFLGAFFLGIGPAAEEKQEENWWDRAEPMSRTGSSTPMALGQQAEMFDESGEVAPAPTPSVVTRSDTMVLPGARPASISIPQTVVSVQSKSASTSRVVATTRSAAAPRVSAVAKTGTPARGAVARQLIMSQSISSGGEESRWFSVPQRVLLPRYQLFEGVDAVTEERGGLRVSSRSMRTQRGHVWFV